MSRESPYQGLIPFSEEDRPYFFGRDADAEIITANLRAAALTVVYGGTGVGKSSVLRAAVIPAINDRARRAQARKRPPELIAVYCQDWRENPLLAVKWALSRTLASLDIPYQSPGDDAALDQHIRAAGAAGVTRVALVLDQFEEYLFYHGTSDRSSDFDQQLAAVIRDSSAAAHVLLSLREDALAGLDQYKGQVNSVFENYLRIGHLDPDAAREAIVAPVGVYCRAQGIPEVHVEPDLVEAIVSQVQAGRLSFQEPQGPATPAAGLPTHRGGGQIEAPYLQIVLSRLWHEEQARGSAALRRATLRELGESETIVRNHLDGIMATLPAAQQETAERIFFHLVTPSGTKVAHALSDLAEFTGRGEAEVAAVLDRLAGREYRILRAVPPLGNLGGPARYQIYHDALSGAIRTWQRAFRAQRVRREMQEEMVREQQQERERIEAQRSADRARLFKRLLIGASSVTVLLAALVFTTWFHWRAADSAGRKLDEQLSLTQQARDLAAARLEAIQRGLQIREAALSGDAAKVQQIVARLSKDQELRFVVTAQYLGYQNGAGQKIYKFEMGPDPASTPPNTIAFITYLANHPTFHNSLMTAGVTRQYRASYQGWGCVSPITAVIEYSNTDRTPSVQQFDMCALLGWQ